MRAEDLLSHPDVMRSLGQRLIASGVRDLGAQQPYRLLEDGRLFIQDKQSNLIPLTLNTCQQKIWTTIKQLRETKKPVRLLILKFRQGGVSTLIEALLYCRTAQVPNRNALILADEEKKSSHLYSMTQRFQEQLERHQPDLAPQLERSNEKGLKFARLDSRIVVGSAENPDIARAFTWQDAHLSEVAHYPPNRVKDLFDGFWPSVADGPHTMVVLETTANGRDPVFYPKWVEAIEGKNDFTPIFLPWFLMEEYRVPLTDGEWYPIDRVVFDTDGELEDFLEEEKQLQAEHGLDDAQLNWRRWCIVNKCSGEVRTFRQEYPATWQEAFQTSGACVFRTSVLRLEQSRAGQAPPKIGRLVELNGDVEFVPDEAGWLRLYEKVNGQQVRIGGDTCEGLPWGEESALVAGNALTRDVLAVVSGTYPPDTLASYAARLGRYYRHPVLEDPPIAIEANGYGHTANQILRQLYGNVYSTHKVDPDTKQEVQRFGFLTTGASRDQLIDLGKSVVREHAGRLRDAKLIEQLFTFVKHAKTGKVDHAHGAFSDLVFAWMIMLWLCEQQPGESAQTIEQLSVDWRYEEALAQIPENYGIIFRPT